MAAAAAETFLTGLSDTSEDDRLIRTSYNIYYFHERARGWLRWRELCAHIVQMREIISSLPALDDVRLIRALRAWMKTARARARHLELMTRALDHLAGEGKGDERGGGADHDAPAITGTKRAPGTTMPTRALRRCLTAWIIQCTRRKVLSMNIDYASSLVRVRRTARGWRHLAQATRARTLQEDAIAHAHRFFLCFLYARCLAVWRAEYRRTRQVLELSSAHRTRALALLRRRRLVCGWDALVRAAIAGVLQEAEEKRVADTAAAAATTTTLITTGQIGEKQDLLKAAQPTPIAQSPLRGDGAGGGDTCATLVADDARGVVAVSPAPPQPPPLPPPPSVSPMKMKAIVLDVEIRLTAAREAIAQLEATLESGLLFERPRRNDEVHAVGVACAAIVPEDLRRRRNRVCEQGDGEHLLVAKRAARDAPSRLRRRRPRRPVPR